MRAQKVTGRPLVSSRYSGEMRSLVLLFLSLSSAALACGSDTFVSSTSDAATPTDASVDADFDAGDIDAGCEHLLCDSFDDGRASIQGDWGGYLYSGGMADIVSMPVASPPGAAQFAFAPKLMIDAGSSATLQLLKQLPGTTRHSRLTFSIRQEPFLASASGVPYSIAAMALSDASVILLVLTAPTTTTDPAIISLGFLPGKGGANAVKTFTHSFQVGTFKDFQVDVKSGGGMLTATATFGVEAVTLDPIATAATPTIAAIGISSASTAPLTAYYDNVTVDAF